MEGEVCAGGTQSAVQVVAHNHSSASGSSSEACYAAVAGCVGVVRVSQQFQLWLAQHNCLLTAHWWYVQF